MIDFDYPNTRELCPSRLEWGAESNAQISTSATTGAANVVTFPGIRWVAGLLFAAQENILQAKREAFWNQVGGQANFVKMWHLMRPVPNGTMRGAPTTNTVLSVGDRTIFMAGTGTLLAGDMIGVNGQLFMVAADVVDASGVLTVPVTTPVRQATPFGTTVTWERPTARFVIQSQRVLVPYQEATVGSSFQVSLVEIFE